MPLCGCSPNHRATALGPESAGRLWHLSLGQVVADHRHNHSFCPQPISPVQEQAVGWIVPAWFSGNPQPVGRGWISLDLPGSPWIPALNPSGVCGCCRTPRGVPGLQTDWAPPLRSLCLHHSDGPQPSPGACGGSECPGLAGELALLDVQQREEESTGAVMP